MKKIIAFDLDGTLTESKSTMDKEMLTLLTSLLEKYKICIISGGDFPQIKKQCLDYLLLDQDKLSKIYIYPTCGTKMYLNKQKKWEKEYSNDFTDKEKSKIINQLENAIDFFDLKPKKIYGELIEDRNTQITYSALGQQAPTHLKKTWDPDFTKRKKIIDYIYPNLSEFSLSMWWSSSIDITAKWIDKAYGMRKLMELTWLNKTDILFVGDALMEWWNDYPVKEMGIETISVNNYNDTKQIIKDLLK